MNYEIIKKLLCAAALLTAAGCCHQPPVNRIATGPHSPAKIYLSPEIPAPIKQTLLLPPLGLKEAGIRQSIQQQLFSAAQRHFVMPLQVVAPDSAYAGYITERNLMNSDGTLNVPEVVMIGQLMNTSHVVCPIFKEIKPYHPQRIILTLTVVETETGQVPAELTAVFDAKESDVRKWFEKYSSRHSERAETRDDNRLKIRSPSTFQAFAFDACFTLLSESLPF